MIIISSWFAMVCNANYHWWCCFNDNLHPATNNTGFPVFWIYHYYYCNGNGLFLVSFEFDDGGGGVMKICPLGKHSNDDDDDDDNHNNRYYLSMLPYLKKIIDIYTNTWK